MRLPAQGGPPNNPSVGAPFQKDPVEIPKNTLLPITMPYMIWSGVPVVQAQTNGDHAERFAISTGLNVNAVTPEMYTRLELQASTRQFRVNVLDASTQATEALIQKLQLGSIQFTNVSTVLTDVFALLSPRPHPDAPSGWLGTPFLSAFQVTFDFAHHALVLEAPKTAIPNPPGTIQVPFHRRDGRIWVKVSVPRAKAFEAVLDTSAVTTLIPTETAEKLNIAPVQVFPITKGNGREARAGLIVVPKLNVGKLEATDVRAVFLAAEAQPPFDKTLGVLGMDFLQRYRITINFDKQKIAFTPNTKPEESEGDTAEKPDKE